MNFSGEQILPYKAFLKEIIKQIYRAIPQKLLYCCLSFDAKINICGKHSQGKSKNTKVGPFYVLSLTLKMPASPPASVYLPLQVHQDDVVSPSLSGRKMIRDRCKLGCRMLWAGMQNTKYPHP